MSDNDLIICTFFDGVAKMRDRRGRFIEETLSNISINGVRETGARVFVAMGDAAWALDACDYVLRCREEVVDLPSFELFYESITDDLVARAAAQFNRVEPAEYYKELSIIREIAFSRITRMRVGDTE
jgi:hypothetical protein